MPVISATWEAEVEGSRFEASPRQKLETLFEKQAKKKSNKQTKKGLKDVA
jgi:hypothetical protein